MEGEREIGREEKRRDREGSLAPRLFVKVAAYVTTSSTILPVRQPVSLVDTA